jgi:hypothetical protein
MEGETIMKYQITRTYKDSQFFTENVDNIASAFAAAAIYLEDPDCISIMIMNAETHCIIVNYWAE